MTGDLVPIKAHVNIMGRERVIVIASAYFPGDEISPPPAEVRRLVEFCGGQGLPLLLGCDANAHNTAWGSTDVNHRGEYLLEFLVTSGLEILNVGNRPTFVTSVREEVLDITVATPSIARLVKGWKVSEEDVLSDHRMIEFSLEGLGTSVPSFRNPRRANWEKYRGTLGHNLSGISSRKGMRNWYELEDSVNQVNGAIVDAFRENCPEKPRGRERDAVWWNSHLSALRTELRRLSNRAKRSGQKQEYRARLTEYNKAVRKAKRDSFRGFCESMGSLPEAARVYRAFARGGPEMVMSLRKEDGSYTNGLQERAELLLRTHFPGSIAWEGEQRVGRLRNSGVIRREAASICTGERIKWALSTFQPFKSPGPDGIYPALLQEGIGDLLPYLVNIYRSSLALGYIPTAWRRARVVFIPKLGKRDMTHPKSFRPISLTSFMLKTLEKVVDNYIRCGILQRVPLHPWQHAYRAGRSTETALADLVGSIRESLGGKEIAVCAFLDIEGAFDNTSHEAIEKALMGRGVGSMMSMWMAEVLRTRSVETDMGDEVTRVSTTRGCPQGGVLSPLMWSLVVDELLRKLSGAGIDCQGYADDIVLMARGKFESTLCDIIQRGLRIVNGWCGSTGLNINPSKTTIVPFTRRRKLPQWRNIEIAGEIVPQRKEIKYLGIILDSKLSWKAQVKSVSSRAKHALMVCRRLAGKSWGCRPRIMYWLYTMMVRPMVTYGAIVWAEGLSSGVARAELDRVQRLACMSITGAMRTCPTAALETLLDLSPLHIVVGSRALETAIRIRGTGDNTGRLGKYGRWASGAFGNPLLDCPVDRTGKLYDFGKHFRVMMSNKSEWSSLEAAYSLRRGTIRWYTDGSRTEEGTGAGIYGPGIKYSEPLGRLASIFQAEVYAIGRCVQINLDRGYKGKDIAILSDSQAAIRALGSYEVDSKLVWDCLSELNRLGRENRVSLCWVPGHSGIQGNEWADELAKRGASMPLIGPEPFCGIGRGVWKGILREKEDRERRAIFLGQRGLRLSKLLLGNYNRKRFEFCIRLSRNSLRILTGLLTGHCRLNGHLYRMGIVSSQLCRFCDEEIESSEHILGACGALMRFRKRHLGAYQVVGGEMSLLTPADILKFVRETGLGDIL